MTDCGGALRRIECDGPLLKSVKFTYILRAKIHEHPSVMWRREDWEEEKQVLIDYSSWQLLDFTFLFYKLTFLGSIAVRPGNPRWHSRGIQKSLPGLTGASMRDDLCSFYGKQVLSKRKQEKIRKWKQNKTAIMGFSFCSLFSQFRKLKLHYEPKTVFQEVRLISGIYNHWLFMVEEKSTAYWKT